MGWAEEDDNIDIDVYVGKNNCIKRFEFKFTNSKALFVYGGNAIGHGTIYSQSVLNSRGLCNLPGLKKRSIVGADIRLRQALIEFKKKFPTRVQLLAGRHDVFPNLKTKVDVLVEVIMGSELLASTVGKLGTEDEPNL